MVLAQESGAQLGANNPGPRKHSPVVWNGAKGPVTAAKSPELLAKSTPKKEPQTIAETAALELERFKQSQQAMGFDPDAPAALKASPSFSGSEKEEGGNTLVVLTVQVKQACH